MKFGEFVRELRTEKRLKLREFCSLNGHDPSNWSKMERGDMPPTENRETLELWAKQLGIERGSDKWYMFFDLAYQERGKIPDDLLSDKEVVECLPLFFRTLRGQKPSEDDLNNVIELLRNRNL